MVTLKIETKTDSYEGAVILIKEALRQIGEGAQGGIIGGGMGECVFDVDLSAAQPLCALDEAYPYPGSVYCPHNRLWGECCSLESPRQ